MSDSSYPSQQQDKFVLRLPDGMRDRIKAAAEANNRSMNSEIVATLEEKYPTRESMIASVLETIRKIQQHERNGMQIFVHGSNTPISADQAAELLFNHVVNKTDAPRFTLKLGKRVMHIVL